MSCCLIRLVPLQACLSQHFCLNCLVWKSKYFIFNLKPGHRYIKLNAITIIFLNNFMIDGSICSICPSAYVSIRNIDTKTIGKTEYVNKPESMNTDTNQQTPQRKRKRKTKKNKTFCDCVISY